MATFDSVKVSTRQAVRSQLASVARKANAKVMDTEPRPVAVTRIVDGVEGASEDAARTQIIYRYARANEAVAFALQFVRARSPVDSGRYRDSWFAMVEGVRIEDPRAIRAADVTITNDQPYSRKIDTGRMKMSVPPHIVEAAAQAVNARYGQQVTARVAYIALPGGYTVKHPQASGRRSKRGAASAAQMTYPAVIIKVR